MKCWFYIEGDSEYYLVEWLIRNYFHNVTIYSNLTGFIQTASSENLCYIHNCGSISKIPYEVNERNHWIESSGAKYIFIVCDIETDLNCPIERRKKILDIMEKIKDSYSPPVDMEKIGYIFSEPTIEEIYCFHSELTKNVLLKLYKRKFNTDCLNINISVLEDKNKSPVFRMKSFFQQNNLTYKETEFAENFFPQLDYKASENATIKRLYKMVEMAFSKDGN
jgi:hypothetical protein